MLVYACGISMEISELRVKNLCLRLEWCSWHFAEKIASLSAKNNGTAEAANCRSDIAGTTCAAGLPEVISTSNRNQV